MESASYFETISGIKTSVQFHDMILIVSVKAAGDDAADLKARDMR